jgi:hypothetical protein
MQNAENTDAASLLPDGLVDGSQWPVQWSDPNIS